MLGCVRRARAGAMDPSARLGARCAPTAAHTARPRSTPRSSHPWPATGSVWLCGPDTSANGS